MSASEARGRQIVGVRSWGRCEVCNGEGQSIHHRVKRSAGGTWDPANLLRLCGDGTRGCHGWIEAHPAHAFALGLWVSRSDDPAAVPALIDPALFARGWWLLDSDGMVYTHPGPPPSPELAAAEDALAKFLARP